MPCGQSLKLPQLYYTIGKENTIDINTKLKQDDILTLNDGDYQVIPLQKTYASKVQLITNEYPNEAGIYSVKSKDEVLNKLSNIKSNNETSDINESLSLVKAMTKNYKSYKLINFKKQIMFPPC